MGMWILFGLVAGVLAVFLTSERSPKDLRSLFY
jgi:uncharacterized membrane protein YeaQ/YmgE (transglycosylase-associated protein family)